MKVIQSVKQVKLLTRRVRDDGKTIGFVPTMGALHEGHLSLIREARRNNDFLVISIFVNPLQFCPGEDYECYPREMESDASKAEQEGVDMIFTPSQEEMYKNQLTTVDVQGMESKLCGPLRPGHFTGVATVVLKLFNIVQPHRSYFGEKDYQQLTMLKKMGENLNLDTDIIGCPIVRTEEGLALSSRNKYLSPKEKMQASIIYKCILSARQMVKKGTREAQDVEEIIKRKLIKNDVNMDYVTICHPATLEPVNQINDKDRIFIAGSIGKTHLIDNGILEIP